MDHVERSNPGREAARGGVFPALRSAAKKDLLSVKGSGSLCSLGKTIQQPAIARPTTSTDRR